ncbi:MULTISPECIES: hypothetical protein [unclassified Staphylococcus]|uniref:hypothetical protein n=1 Tax=unclassified Staphylococcus TaxID=91994 RepID=UPI0021D09C2F|nr:MULTISPECIES: hypothetical protein [unclassified Staphylococcus]UXR70143.1 hypothetical protein MUA26_03140 [Staphylococcus sp. IVB6246]UXR72202.1 hypothetical protein MUA88_03220 [Staphylococcus sp. IVB6240]UXR74511.1 hypothetical protein MUA48_03395 [Staphylococcus sp. IVB6238]UXR76895.1 hypothetical protein MUA74_03760 [Staphylococcus sp. IVB6233]UXR81021.1 hypothetical protein MUA65_03365 [Staphylococcus sp. IVB6218]
MVSKERGTITLNKHEAIIFATGKFKPFNNMLKKENSKINPFKKIEKHENK